jgi:alpha-beta hydrolase superfamily lysophospholipase
MAAIQRCDMPQRYAKLLVLIWVVWFLLAALIAANAVAFMHARAMLRFSGNAEKSKNPEQLSRAEMLRILVLGISNPRPADREDPAAHGLPFEQRVISADAGITLGAWLVPHSAPVGHVVMFHGYTASKGTLLLEAKAFQERGYAALLVDFRGSADSSEAYTSVGYHEADDVRAALEYARRDLGWHQAIVYGRSMGAAAVLRAISLYALPVRALIIEGVFDRMLSTVKQRFDAMGIPATPFAHLLVLWGGAQHGFWGFAHNPRAYARNCQLPTLMLHGSEDPRATIAQARTVLDALRGPKTLCEFVGAGHEQLPLADRARWDGAVDGLLRSLERI